MNGLLMATQDPDRAFLGGLLIGIGIGLLLTVITSIIYNAGKADRER
jgi:HD-like signal output (HDOD) protein